LYANYVKISLRFKIIIIIKSTIGLRASVVRAEDWEKIGPPQTKPAKKLNSGLFFTTGKGVKKNV